MTAICQQQKRKAQILVAISLAYGSNLRAEVDFSANLITNYHDMFLNMKCFGNDFFKTSFRYNFFGNSINLIRAEILVDYQLNDIIRVLLKNKLL